jgi:catechol 2,3-dioxygenase-like lactoylglutathione lyase family enzyme
VSVPGIVVAVFDHVTIRVSDRAASERFYRDDGTPGPRPQYGPDDYCGFLLDPDSSTPTATTSRP